MEYLCMLPPSYDAALQRQAMDFQMKDRVCCFKCMKGLPEGNCRCKFVDERGKLAGVGSMIYFLPGEDQVVYQPCTVQGGNNRFGPHLCRFRIREIRGLPRRQVWVRCDEESCIGNYYFPYGLGIMGGSHRWVDIGQVTRLVKPFIPSVLARMRLLRRVRRAADDYDTLLHMLMDLYGLSTITSLSMTCREMNRDCTLRTLVQVYNP